MNYFVIVVAVVAMLGSIFAVLYRKGIGVRKIGTMFVSTIITLFIIFYVVMKVLDI